MTMICPAKNKADLKEKLTRGCTILEPTPFGDKQHRSEMWPIGKRAPVVLDPETRRRFAQIEKRADGTWAVK